MDELRKQLAKTWESNLLMCYSMTCAGILSNIYGHEYNQGYLVGLSFFLYWQDVISLTDEELDGYIKSIMSLSKNNKFKQIYARS